MSELGGPNGDGSKHLARESKFGNLLNGATVALAGYLAVWVGDLDFTPLPDQVEPILVAAAGVAVGLLTSYVTRNRKTTSSRL